MTTLSTRLSHWTVVLDARPAPTRPPMRAWVDDDGRPNRQVMRFQMIAPMSAANTTTSPWVPLGVEMIPSPTVIATPVDTSAPTTLSPAAIESAVIGESARVVIETATALAASWNPLVKSKPNATAMRTTRPRVCMSKWAAPTVAGGITLMRRQDGAVHAPVALVIFVNPRPSPPIGGDGARW